LVGPTDPDNPIPVKVEIKIDYYRVAPTIPGRTDRVSVGCSWMGYRGHDMQKIEENHYFYQAEQKIDAPTLTYAKDKYRLDLVDYGLGVERTTNDVYVNGKKIVIIEAELGGKYLCFWVDAQGNIITNPQGS
jgi:hypothetical protein